MNCGQLSMDPADGQARRQALLFRYSSGSSDGFVVTSRYVAVETLPRILGSLVWFSQLFSR